MKKQHEVQVFAENEPSEKAIREFNEFRRVIVQRALEEGRLKPPAKDKEAGA